MFVVVVTHLGREVVKSVHVSFKSALASLTSTEHFDQLAGLCWIQFVEESYDANDAVTHHEYATQRGYQRRADGSNVLDSDAAVAIRRAFNDRRATKKRVKK